MTFGALWLDVTGSCVDCDEFAAILDNDNNSGNGKRSSTDLLNEPRMEIDRTQSDLMPQPSELLTDPDATGEEVSSAFRHRRGGVPAEEDAFLLCTQDQRVALLARKYIEGRHFSDEEDARLRILTERLRRLIPRVTTEDLEKIEALVVDVNEANKQNQAIRRRLGLDD